jgi:uncharacterized protein with PQ loop repeat
MDITALLATAATLFGLLGACSFLLQARRMVRRSRSQDVSLGFLGTVTGGYLLWLLYGVAIDNVPLIVVDAIGFACACVTWLVALRLRSSPGWLAVQLNDGAPGADSAFRR